MTVWRIRNVSQPSLQPSTGRPYKASAATSELGHREKDRLWTFSTCTSQPLDGRARYNIEKWMSHVLVESPSSVNNWSFSCSRSIVYIGSNFEFCRRDFFSFFFQVHQVILCPPLSGVEIEVRVSIRVGAWVRVRLWMDVLVEFQPNFPLDRVPLPEEAGNQETQHSLDLVSRTTLANCKAGAVQTWTSSGSFDMKTPCCCLKSSLTTSQEFPIKKRESTGVNE